MSLNSSGQLTTTGSHYSGSGYYYDNTNTSYYVYPSGTSNLSAVNLTNTSTGGLYYFNDSANVWQGSIGFSGTSGQLNWPGRNATIATGYNATLTLATGASGYNSGSVSIPYGTLNVTGSSFYLGGTYYDNANTGYYVKPSGTSNFNIFFAGLGNISPSSVAGFGAANIYDTTSGFSAPGICFGNGTGSHGAIVYGSSTMYFGTENGSSSGTMTTRMTLTTSANLNVNGNVTAYYSDKRLKDIQGSIQNALSKVMSLNGVYYKNNQVAKENGFKNDDLQVGVIAQEVQEVLPQVVKPAPFDTDRDEDGIEFSKSGMNYVTVQYERIVPLLIEAIKEQQAIIDSQEARLQRLEELLKK